VSTRPHAPAAFDDIPPPPPLARRKGSRRLRHRDANGQALAYIYSRDNQTEALQAEGRGATDPGAAVPLVSLGLEWSRTKRDGAATMTVIGYARVSTTDQALSIQEAALKAAWCPSEPRSGGAARHSARC
jgi:hypothetical protein